MLTEREQEALQALAREMVSAAREAELAQDTPQEEAAEQERKEFIEAGREHWKAQVDYFKHMSTISGATIIGEVAVIAGFVPKAVEDRAPLLYFSLTFLFLSAILSLFSLGWASARLARFSWGDALPSGQVAPGNIIRRFLRRLRNFAWSWPLDWERDKAMLSASYEAERRITYTVFYGGIVCFGLLVLFGP
jgi:hypothetical protein